jgi:hypothetical protein
MDHLDDIGDIGTGTDNDYAMTNSLIRIAKDLEKVLIGIYVSVAVLGLIAAALILQTLLGE